MANTKGKEKTNRGKSLYQQASEGIGKRYQRNHAQSTTKATMGAVRRFCNFLQSRYGLQKIENLKKTHGGSIRKDDVSDRYIKLQRSIVLKKEKEMLKNDFRFRRVQITVEIRKILDQIINQCPNSPYLFAMEEGGSLMATASGRLPGTRL